MSYVTITGVTVSTSFNLISSHCSATVPTSYHHRGTNTVQAGGGRRRERGDLQNRRGRSKKKEQERGVGLEREGETERVIVSCM